MISLEKRETLPEDVTETDFNAYVTAANNAISPFDLEIRSTFHQTTRKRVFALVNSTSDPITQLATTHSADEISFLKRVLDAMFETYNTPRHEVMAITSMQAVRLHKPPSEDRRETQNGSATQGSAGQGLTMMQAEKMLKTLVEEGWFEKSRKGYYSLSPRALMELRGWLMESYNDAGDEDEDGDGQHAMKIKQCYACREIITIVSILINPSTAGKLRSSPGSAMSQKKLPMPSSRYLHAEFLPGAEGEKVSYMQDRLDGNRFRWRTSSCINGEIEAQGQWWVCQSRKCVTLSC